MPNSDIATDESQARPRRRRKYRRWIVLAIIVGAVFWLNGPGIRWLGPKIASRFLEKSGFETSFSLEGSLSGGLSIRNLILSSGTPLGALTISRATPIYQIRELYYGRLDGIEIDGLHAELRLGLENGKKKAEPRTPFDSGALVKTLRSLRNRVLPTSIAFTNISLEATRDGKPVISLAPSGLRHSSGTSSFELELGSITDLTGREWPAQKSNITWNADDLLIDRIDPLPGIGIRELVVRTPEGGGLSAETELRLEEAVFMIEAPPGLSSLSIDLREGRLASGPVVERFGLKVPVSAELTSLSLNVDNLLPDPSAATGEARILLEKIVSGEWTVPELSLDVELAADRASMAASGQALGTGFTLDAAGPVSRDGGKLLPGDMSGRFNVAEVSKLVDAIKDKVKAIDPDAPVPASMLDGGFGLTFDGMKPASADVDLVVKPADPKLASSLAVKGRWQPETPVTADLTLEGMVASGQYDILNSTYKGDLDLKSFKTARIDPWLALFRASTKGAADLTATWQGSGDVKKGTHLGRLILISSEIARDGVPATNVTGDISYDWPSGFVAKDLVIKTRDQTIATDATLGGGFLELSRLRWQDRETEMAGGSAKLPVPADFSKWRDMIADDARPLELSVKSKVLSLAVLKDWVPAASKLDAASTGQVNLKVSGTYANPVIDAVIEARDLRSPDQPKLPPADLKITLAGKEGHLAVVGSLIAPDFQPATITASMPFLPAAWAEQPALIKTAKITARADLPRVDLSRFASLVAPARKVGGVLTSHVEVAGEIGKPEIKGFVELTGGVIELKDERIPAITGIGATVDLSLERITLKNLKATIAAGTLQGGGSIAIKDGKPGDLDFRITGNHLPVLRNDSLIIRANADLRLTGPWQTATLAGSVGVVDSLFFRDIEILPIGTPFTGPAAASLPKVDAPVNPAQSVPEPFRNWNLNLRARTENGFLIRGNLANGRVDADLRIGGTLGKPAPIGEAHLTNLRAQLPFSTLTVRSGFLRFTPETGFDPVLEIRGKAEPRPYQVNAYVYGRASNPQLVLTSNPPLPENEIMTLLATGTTTTGLENPQMASSRAMQLLAEEIRRGRFGVGKQLRPLLGLLDRVDFSLAEADPYTSESFSTATLSITDRWYLSAGLGAEGDSRVLAIWRLSFR